MANNLEQVPPTRDVLNEALRLAEEIISSIELSEGSLTNTALKASRLARLLNDFRMQKIMQYEASGYPTKSDGVPPQIWQLLVHAGRIFDFTDAATKKVSERSFLDSIDSLEAQIRTDEVALSVAKDPDGNQPGPSNPYLPKGNSLERASIRRGIRQATDRLASRRNFVYQYAVEKYYELKFSGIASDVFGRIRERVDTSIGAIVPDAVQQFSAVYENLRTENPENWANAVHGCRRILQNLADAVFPPTDQQRTKNIGGKTITIKLGNENYINRLIAFIEDSSDSKRFEDIVGSNLAFMGDRLDALFKAAQKGSHSNIVSSTEADRYVVYTYLLVGDVLSLRQPTESGRLKPSQNQRADDNSPAPITKVNEI